MNKQCPQKNKGFSLLEVLAVVTILGIVAGLAFTRFAGIDTETNRNACFVNKGDIELQSQLWRRNNQTYPAANLSNIGSDVLYYPEGLPTCPVDGTAYTIDANGSVVGHTH